MHTYIAQFKPRPEANGGSCGINGDLLVICTGTNAWANGPQAHLTLGNTIITDRDALSAEDVAHEADHSTQWAILGPLFPPAYFAAEATSQLSGNGSCQIFETVFAGPNSRYDHC